MAGEPGVYIDWLHMRV